MFYKINAKSTDKIKYTQIFWQEKTDYKQKNYPTMAHKTITFETKSNANFKSAIDNDSVTQFAEAFDGQLRCLYGALRGAQKTDYAAFDHDITVKDFDAPDTVIARLHTFYEREYAHEWIAVLVLATDDPKNPLTIHFGCFKERAALERVLRERRTEITLRIWDKISK